MKITINNEEKEVKTPTRIIDLIDDKEKKYYAALVNNRLRELNYIISADAEVKLLDLTDASVTRIYQATLRYIVAMATKRVFPKAKINYNYSVSRSIFATLSNFDRPFLHDDLAKIKEEVDKIIAADLPITRFTLTKEEACNYYNSIGQTDKVKILKYRPGDTVHVYKCGDYCNYMLGYMLSSTGYVKDYAFRLYSPGFLISYPRSECGGKIPQFKDEKVFRGSLKEANIWGNTAKSSYIYQLNEIVQTGRALEFVNICEARHNRQLAELGAKIQAGIDHIRLICVAGPSSSGKTTFTNRLRIELKSRGIEPLMISMDNFYNSVDEAPKDENGNPDLEHINALDLKLFDETIFKLIQGEKVRLPIFDFKTKQRLFEEPISISHNQPILIEGIHGLNDMIAPSIPDDAKFKVFIAPLTQIKLDSQNPISISDIRLIRRMVRDYQYRNTGCEKTIEMWQSVRNGEFKWIYPYQNNADFVYNSELSYELCVMKKHALPLLMAVPSDSPNYIVANRLVKFLKYFEDISDKWIPCNSILREFIGDSIFYTEDKI